MGDSEFSVIYIYIYKERDWGWLLHGKSEDRE